MNETTATTEAEVVEMFDALIDRVDAVSGPASGLRFAVMKAEGEQPDPDPSLVEKADAPIPDDDSDPEPEAEGGGDAPEAAVAKEGDAEDKEPVEKSFAAEDVGAPLVEGEIVPGATTVVVVDGEPVVKVETEEPTGPMSGTLDMVLTQAGLGGETPIQKAVRLAANPHQGTGSPGILAHDHVPFPADLGNSDEVAKAAGALAERNAEAPVDLGTLVVPSAAHVLKTADLGIAKQSTPGTPTEPAPEPEPVEKADGDAAGEAMVPSSPAWEAEDADKARQATEALVGLRALVEGLTDREGVEVAAGDEDPMDLLNLVDVGCALDFALTVLARFAVDEAAEAAGDVAEEPIPEIETAPDGGMSDEVVPEFVEKSTLSLASDLAGALYSLADDLDGVQKSGDPVEKVGRRISANTEAQLRSAMTAIQAVLQEQKTDDVPAPDGTAAEDSVDKINDKEGKALVEKSDTPTEPAPEPTPDGDDEIITIKKSEFLGTVEDAVRAATESLEARVKKVEGSPDTRGPVLMPGAAPAAPAPILRDQGPAEDPEIATVRKEFEECLDPETKAELGTKLSLLNARGRYGAQRIVGPS